MHGNANRAYNNILKLQVENTYVPGLLVDFFLFESKIQSNSYREAVTLKLTSIWNSGEIEDRTKIFTKFLFQRPCINNFGTQRFKTLLLTHSPFINNYSRQYYFKHGTTILKCMKNNYKYYLNTKSNKMRYLPRNHVLSGSKKNINLLISFQT